jgi:hypothetical protein
VVRDRLAKLPQDRGLDSVEAIATPVTPEEAVRHRVPAGRPVPVSLLTKLHRALAAEVPVLVEAGVIPSAEVLARVIPQITAEVRSAGIADPALRRLYQALYGAFRRRRSLLLLNLESQVKFTELPWVAAIWRRSDLSSVNVSGLPLTGCAWLWREERSGPRAGARSRFSDGRPKSTGFCRNRQAVIFSLESRAGGR